MPRLPYALLALSIAAFAAPARAQLHRATDPVMTPASSLVLKDDGSAEKLLSMIHGRGASADDILSLTNHLELTDFSIAAPQAPEYTWYPFSFMVPRSQNQPYLDRSLSIIDEIVTNAITKGVAEKNIYFLGFSQGACLSLEYWPTSSRRI